MSVDADARDPVERLGEEFLDRRRRGERPTIQEYAAAYPNHADGIRQLFPAMVALERFKIGNAPLSDRPIGFRQACPAQLGDYRIKFEIGRGGMGVVYEAEQQSLSRQVAVKVFPREAIQNSRQLKRFHREAQTAARLHHTNIVPVFGVGEQDGLHYYVMQRIHGFGLDTFIANALAKRNESAGHTTNLVAFRDSALAERPTWDPFDASLTTGESDKSKGQLAAPTSLPRLAEFRDRRRESYWCRVADIGIQVAGALEYAHAQGVVHRDIKPGNLIRDSRGTVWVADFGLATAAEAERLSNPGDMVGTLRFMAPEALTGTHDARSDLYALGVTMYELLTFRPAFEEPTRQQLAHRILEGDFERPRSIDQHIPRDLEAIVLNAMNCESSRRYQTASDLQRDLQRFLDDRPVRARPIGAIGRLGRWTQRNPLIGGLSAALLVVFIAAFIGIGAKWRDAVTENRRAEDNLSLALESMDQMLGRFASGWMAHPTTSAADDRSDGAPAIEYQMAVSDYSAEVLQDALQFYDRFAKQNAANPKLQMDTAKVHRRVGDIYERLGQWPKAEEAYLRALDILDDDANVDPAHGIERAITLNQLGLTTQATRGAADATDEFRRARQILMMSKADGSPVCRYELARTNINLGQSLLFSPQRREAGERYREAIQLLQGLVTEFPDEVDYRLALAQAYNAYYPIATFRRGGTDSDTIRSDGIAMLEQLVEEFPTVPDYRCELSEMLMTTGRRGNAVSAESLQRAVELVRRTASEHPAIPRYRAVLARGLKEQAELTAKSRPHAADALFTEAIVLYQSLVNSFSDNPAYYIFLATALEGRSRNLTNLQRDVNARETLADAIECRQEYMRLRPDSRFGKSMLIRQYKSLAEMLRKSGLAADAAEIDELAVELQTDFTPRREVPHR